MGKTVKTVKKIISLLKTKNVVTIPQIVDENKLLNGKTAVIVGGTGGIGHAIAKGFLESGCKVIITGTNQKKLAETLEKFKDVNVKGMVLDLGKQGSFNDKVKEAVSIFGRVDILVNSGGVHSENIDYWKMSEAEYDRIMDINLKGAFFLCQAFGKYMRDNAIKGHILLISSSRGSEPAYSPYGLSKWGLNGMTQGLAKLLLPHGIIVNAIAPGSTATPLLGIKEGDNLYCDENGMERYIIPDEVAAYARMLVSDMGNVVIGETIHVSAGRGVFDIR